MENEEKEGLTTENAGAKLESSPNAGGVGIRGEVVEVAEGENFKAAEKYDDFAKEDSIDSRHFSLEDEIKTDNSFATSEEKRGLGTILAKSKKKILIAVALLLLIAVAAAAYLLTQKNDAPAVTSQEQGDTIVKSSMEAMKAVKSYNYEGKLDFGFDTKENSLGSSDSTTEVGISIDHNGVVDYSNADAPASYSALALDINTNSGEEKATGKLGMELAYLDKTFYIKLKDFTYSDGSDETAASLKQAEGFLEIVRNNWYFVSEADMQSFAQSVSGAEAPAENAVNPESIAKLNEIINNHDLLRFYKDLGADTVNGTETYHYQVQMDSKEGFELAVELIKESLRAQGEDEAADSFEQELKDKTDEVNKAKELVDFVLNEMNAQIWIGKSDNMVYRVKIDGNFDKDFLYAFRDKVQAVYGEEGDSSAADETEAEINLNFNLDYTLSNFNTAAVRKPEDAKDLKKVIESFSGQSLDGMTSSLGATDTDSDGLSDEQEKFYGSDANKADTDGDGYKDGDEIKNGYDPTVAGSAKLDYSKLYNVK